MATGVDSLLIRPPVNGLGDHFRICDGRRVERSSSPSHIERHPREVDDAAVAAVAAQIVRRAHEDAIDRARLDAQRTKHALGVVDREACDLEAFAVFDSLLADLIAIDWASLRTLVASDAGRQVVAVKAAIARSHRHRLLRIFESMGEGSALRLVGNEPVAERDPHSMTDGINRQPDISQPIPHGGAAFLSPITK
jgi:hypothetical protein